MYNQKNIDDLTEEDIRNLLAAKLRANSGRRLEHFRRSGRLVELVPEVHPLTLDTLFTSPMNEQSVRRRSVRPRNRPTNMFLLFIEVVAILGIIYIVINGIGLHHLLNRAVAVALQLPTITPTPLISAIVLPTGHVHTSLSSSSQVQVNDADIPLHLRPLVQPPAYLPPVPTPAPQHGIRIQIPAIDVDSPIVHGDGWEQLMKGVAHHPNSADPGQIGNIVLSGHNDIYGEVFRYLEELKAGDEIIVYTGQRSYTYIISGWELVEPAQVEVMAPTVNATITLISCHPYLVDNHRIIVKGSLLN